MKTTLTLSALLAVLLCLSAVAETYNYTPYRECYSGSWDNPSNWTTSAGLYGMGYPSAPGDTAIILGGGTNLFVDSWQLYPNNFTDTVANVGHVLFAISNSVLVGNLGAGKYLILNNPGQPHAVWALTNMVPDNQYYFNDYQVATYWDLVMILSNDLDLYISSVPYEYLGETYTDAGGFAFDVDNIVGGDHAINVYGGGTLNLGNSYTSYSPTPAILITQPLTVHGGGATLNESAIINPPLVMHSITDCKNVFQRSTLYGVGVPDMLVFNVDLESYNGYYNMWDDWKTNRVIQGGTYNRGSVTTREWGLFGPPAGCVLQFDCDARGAEFWKGYSASAGGDLEFLGSLSPGIDSMDLMYIVGLATSGVCRIGTKNNKVDVNIEINGLRDFIALDNDTLAFDNVGAVGLGNMDLKLTVGWSNPYRTNIILYSNNAALAGDFNSVSWIGGRTGEVIVTPDTVYVTGIPPSTTNFFDVQPDSLIMLVGQTAAVVTVQSPYTVNVNVSNDKPWLAVAPQIAVPANTPVQAGITVPAGLPTTNGYGFSRGSVWYVAPAQPQMNYEVPVYVVQTGYFELDQNRLYYMADQADYQNVAAFAPFAANLSAAALGAPWITNVTPAVFALNDADQNVNIGITAAPAGSTGTVRFTNTGVPGVTHDVAVYVVANGFFETVEQELVFTPGETQKWFEIFSPFRAEVDMQGSAPWIEVESHISLNDDAWLVPVTIPAGQPVDSTGTVTLVNSCFTNITSSVAVTVVPEAGVTALLAVTALGLLRRRRRC